MTRIKAATSHFIISAALSAIVIGLLLFGWYPLPYFWALGGLLLLVMIVGVDVVLGPLMTLILFNPKKSRRALILDLTLIAIVQITALGYGLYSGYMSRLVFTVFDGQSFQLVQAGDVLPNFLKRTQRPEYQTLPFAGHRFAMAQVPNDEATYNDLKFYRAFGVGPHHMTHYYVPLQAGREQLAKAALSHAQLQTKHPELATQVDAVVRGQQLNWQDVAVLPFAVKTKTYTAVVRLNPVEMLKVLSDDPR